MIMQLDRKWGVLLAFMLALFAYAGRAAAQSAPSPNFIDSQVLYAVVDATGVLSRGNGAISATSFGGGAYEVIFFRDVTACAYKATVGLSGSAGTSTPGTVQVVGRAGTPAGVFLTTDDSAGIGSDRGFHLAVICP
jgi:hypothetical protein